MRLLRSFLILILLGSIGYQANAYYQYRKAAEAVPPRVNTVTARSGTLRITLSGTGTLQALKSQVVAVREVQSQLTSIVDDGAMVKAGQVVAQLGTTQILKELRDRQTAFDTARAAVPKTEADVLLNLNNAATKAKKAQQDQALLVTTNSAATQGARAQLDFNGGELDHSRHQRDLQATLARDRLVPQQRVEEAGLDVERKNLGVVIGSKELEVKQHAEKIGTSQGEMLIEDAKFGEAAAKSKADQQRENARFNMLQAKTMLEMSQRQLDYCTIKAPISGLAVVARQWDEGGGQRPLRAGDQVYPSRGLMEIIDTARMIVQADVGEIDIGHVRKGQQARVFPRAAPGTALRARVMSVSEVAQTPPFWRANRTPGKKVFRVMLELLDSRPKLLRPEMTVDFELVEEEIDHGVHVPIQSVFTRGSDKVVYLRKNGRYWPKTITLGKRNDNDVLVTKGLAAGDVLAEQVPPASLIGAATQNRRPARSGGLLSLLPWSFHR